MTWPRIRWRKIGKYFTFLFLLLLLCFAGLLWYVTTDSFQQMVRRRLIASLERSTGGRVELGSFHAVPLHFQVEVRNLTIHGREAASEQPYAHVDSLVAIINLSSALGAKIAFHSLTLQHPVIHIIFYPDGSTNQPTPKQNGAADFEQLFAFFVRRLDVHQGELLWQDQRIPLDFSSKDVSAKLNYSFLHQRYSGTVALGKAETKFDGYRPVAWTGQAAFNLDRSGIQVQSLQAKAERSRLQASGLVTDFRNPAFKGNYDLTLDLARAAAVSRQPPLKSGMLHLSGSASWSRETFASSGKFGVRGLTWDDKSFSGREVAASGKFSLDPRKLSLSKIEGQMLHGLFSADAEVVNWQAPPEIKRTATKNANKNLTKNEEQQGTIKIRTKDLSLAELLAGLGSEFRVVNKLKFAGNVSGTAEVRWKQSIRYAEATAAAEASPPSHLQSGQIPLTASGNANYDFRSGELQIAEFSANTPATQIQASGGLKSSVRLSFATNGVDEWRPAISQLFPSGPPATVHGRAVFNGTVAGKGSDLRLAGNLQLQDFEASVPIKGRDEPMHWDSLNTDVQISSNSLGLHNAVLREGDATVKLDGSAGLVAWELTPKSPLHFHIDAQDADAGAVATLAGYDREISGKLSASVDVTGTSSKPQGQGNVSLSDGTILDQAFNSASASLSLTGNQIAFKDLRLERGDARVTGDGNYDLSSQSLGLDLHGTNFDLAGLAPFDRSKVKLSGKLDFVAKASGTTAEPQVSADLHVRNVTVNDQPAGDFLLNAVSHGADTHLTGHSESKNVELALDGDVRLRDQWPAQINLLFNHLDATPLFESYLRGRTTGRATVAGDLKLQGPLRDPQHLNLAGNLTDVSAEIGKAKFRNEGPVQFAVLDRVLKIEKFHLLGDNADLSGSGSLQLTGDRVLDFEARGRADLKLIQNYDHDLTTSGTLTGEGRVTGTLDDPLIKGKLQIQNGALSDINLPSALSEINGTLLFSQDQVTIDSLNARTGGGTVGFTGHAELVGKQLNFDLTANADSVRLRYPPGVSSTANAQLHWSGSSTGSLLSGDLTVTKLGFTPGFDFGAYLERTAQVSSLPQTDPVLNNIRLDLHVVTTPELQMQTSVIRLQGEADLHVRGSAAKPILLGRADVFEGEAYFSGTKYRLERGGVTFSNPASTTPFLDLEAITRVRDYDVTLSLTGDVSKPNGLKVSYRSDPPLPTADIISLLAFGQTTEESAQLQQTSQPAFSQQASSAMLAAALNATLNNRAQRLFGNSRIKIDPQGIETVTSPTQTGPAVTIEQQVQDNLTLSYTTDVSQTSQQVIRTEYNVSKNVSIVAIRDQNGVVSFDVKIRRRKR